MESGKEETVIPSIEDPEIREWIEAVHAKTDVPKKWLATQIVAGRISPGRDFDNVVLAWEIEKLSRKEADVMRWYLSQVYNIERTYRADLYNLDKWLKKTLYEISLQYAARSKGHDGSSLY